MTWIISNPLVWETAKLEYNFGGNGSSAQGQSARIIWREGIVRRVNIVFERAGKNIEILEVIKKEKTVADITQAKYIVSGSRHFKIFKRGKTNGFFRSSQRQKKRS